MPVTFENYNLDSWECIGTFGARQASSFGHNQKCIKRVKEDVRQLEFLSQASSIQQFSEKITEWRSDLEVLRSFIAQNLSLGPKAIKGKMKELKQTFNIKTIKELRREVLDEIFPKNKLLAFHPSNTLALNSEDNFEDNLLKVSLQFPSLSKGKHTENEVLKFQEVHIFAINVMLFQLQKAKQYFIDGTFSIAPQGFQQVIVLMVLIPELQLFYPSCFILASNKTERLYKFAFDSLISVAKQEGFELNPQLIMADFETGLINAIKSSFRVTNTKEGPKIVNCYFHYVKALIKKAKQLRLITKTNYDDKTKLLIGLLKILSHCPAEKRKDFFAEIELLYKSSGEKYKNYLKYFSKQWLNNPFLEELCAVYKKNIDVHFIRTNNPCELFNKYISKKILYSSSFSIIDQVFGVKKPRAGFFIEKLKEIEFTFRGDYLDGCQGRRRKKKYNFQKNPLENLQLPYQELLDICLKAAHEKQYCLQELQKDSEFVKKIETLTLNYMEIVELHLLKTQAESENLQEAEMDSDMEEEKDQENKLNITGAPNQKRNQEEEEESEEFSDDEQIKEMLEETKIDMKQKFEAREGKL